jgi:hypothetical protein
VKHYCAAALLIGTKDSKGFPCHSILMREINLLETQAVSQRRAFNCLVYLHFVMPRGVGLEISMKLKK